MIIPYGGNKDEFVVAADRHLYKLIWPDCDSIKTKLEKILMVEAEKPRNQFNDGKVDGMGRLWLGKQNKQLKLLSAHCKKTKETKWNTSIFC